MSWDGEVASLPCQYITALRHTRDIIVHLSSPLKLHCPRREYDSDMSLKSNLAIFIDLERYNCFPFRH